MAKITISAYGKFDLFRWAEGFEREGLLYRILTDFYSQKTPFLSKWRKDEERVPIKKVRTFFLPRLLQPVSRKILNTSYWDNSLFDLWAASKIGEADIAISRSSTALNTFKRAKEKGIKTVLYRGSSHIKYSRDIQEEETQIWKVPLKNEADRRTVERELQEYELCDFLYVPSTYAAGTFIKNGIPKERIVSFPLSIGPVPLEKHENPDKFTVLYVGSISLYKGVQYLLEAVREVRKEKDVRLVLAGSISPEMKYTLNMYDGEFEYRGIVPHHEIGKLYKEASVFVFPTIDDGFGQVVLEAMSYGVPIIATTNSCGPDILKDGENGFVVPIRDSGAIAGKILEFANNKDFLESVGKCAKESSEAFSIQNFTNNWIEFFRRKEWI